MRKVERNLHKKNENQVAITQSSNFLWSKSQVVLTKGQIYRLRQDVLFIPREGLETSRWTWKQMKIMDEH